MSSVARSIARTRHEACGRYAPANRSGAASLFVVAPSIGTKNFRPFRVRVRRRLVARGGTHVHPVPTEHGNQREIPTVGDASRG